MRRRAGRRAGERGAVLMITAISLTTLLTFTAIAIDLGYQRVVRRDMQALADVVALDLVRLIDGRTVEDIEDDPAWLQARDDSVARNTDTQGDTPIVTPVLGTVSVTTREFVPMSSGVPNAVQVTAESEVDYFFRGGGRTERTAVAGGDAALGKFSVGSFLADVTPFQEGLLNDLFGDAFGMSVLSYDGIAGGYVEVGDLEAAIGLIKPGAGVDTTLTANEFLLIAAKAAELGGDTVRANLLNNAALVAGNAQTDLTVGDLADIFLPGDDSVAEGSVDLFQFVTTGAMLMDGSHVLTLPGATIGNGLIGTTTVELELISPPAVSPLGPVDVTTARNSQLRITVTPEINISNQQSVNTCPRFSLLNPLATLLGLALCVLSSGIVNRVFAVSLTGTSELVIETAAAEGTLTDVSCGTDPRSITVTPTMLEAASLSGTIALTGQVTIAGSAVNGATPEIALNAPLTVGITSSAGPETFEYADEFHEPRPVGSNPLGLDGLVTLGPLGASLLNVNLTGVADVLRDLIDAALNPVLAALDTVLISPLLAALGIDAAGADVTALDMKCVGGLQLVG